MPKLSLALVTCLLTLALAPSAAAQRYLARQEGEVVRLEDHDRKTSVSIAPALGNIAFEMSIVGQNVLRWPYASLDEFKSRPGLNGIPFLGPFANRLDETAFYANGRKYAFDMDLGNVRGNPIPIHGFLTNAEWKVVAVKADNAAAWVTSKLEVWRNPLWMKQFPFAHTIEMTYRLQDGTLQVTTRIENLSTEPMPVSIGFHPYFLLPDSRRDEWTVSIAAKVQWLLAPNKIPTGETAPIEQFLPDPKAVALKDVDLDHVFGDLIRDADGRAVMTVKGKKQALDIMLGPRYKAVVVYAPKPPAAGAAAASATPPTGPPPDRNFICIEPMVGITDAMNLAQKGLYKELQSIAPGGTWEESFWVRPHGFQ
jgi:aldose 1-epimerase